MREDYVGGMSSDDIQLHGALPFHWEDPLSHLSIPRPPLGSPARTNNLLMWIPLGLLY